ncbi:MAG: phosphoglucosamine mutase [Demequinaceae bacterium]|nr:phosphoglucosamine mutase [Demequinaceae bacterium]
MARLFGTDGVRGIANVDVTPELALDLAIAATGVLVEASQSEGRHRVVIGRDTRISGQFLSHAMAAGLAGAGADVLDVGVIPTPGVAHIVAATDSDFGVVISASHNPMPDNGIKFFAKGGHKVDDAVEEEIEERLGKVGERPTGEDVGTITPRPDLVQAYITHVVDAVKTFSGSASPLAGLKIVADCAHGSASTVAEGALREAGADVVVINAAPTGLNINDGVGSTHIEGLASAVIKNGADLGVAFDGDADRCLAVDHLGALVDGDQLMGLIALKMKAENALYRDTIVATVMSNLGLHRAMRQAGIDIVETAVGDRYVLEAMREAGYSLGGEQSGHIILSEYTTTGDGLLTAVIAGSIVVASGNNLRDEVASIERLPQVLVNVPNVDKSRVFTDAVLEGALADIRASLGSGGRVLLRPSGTEPLVRVMVEAATKDRAEEVAGALAALVASRLALA